jgi:hypothetical protein
MALFSKRAFISASGHHVLLVPVSASVPSERTSTSTSATAARSETELTNMVGLEAKFIPDTLRRRRPMLLYSISVYVTRSLTLYSFHGRLYNLLFLAGHKRALVSDWLSAASLGFRVEEDEIDLGLQPCLCPVASC